MNVLKLSGAVMLAAGLSGAAQAATYTVSGQMTGVNASFPGEVIDISFNPANPAFNGLWDIDLAAATLSGFTDFESYWAHTHITLPGYFDGSTDVQRPHDFHTIDNSGATVSYDPATRTLSIAHGLLVIGGTSENCTAVNLICDAPGTVYQYASDLTMLLTFDPTLQSFTGTSVNVHSFANGYSDSTYWTFSGTEVPVPAAAWLFGSGLIGIAGIARGRNKK